MKLYRYMLPVLLKDRITIYRDASGWNTIRKTILKYYSGLPVNEINKDQKEVLRYLKRHPLSLFPYSFPKKYSLSDIKVFFDEEKKMHFVMHNENRLYFKRSFTLNDIKNNYRDLLVEQDALSPHKYVSKEFNVPDNSVLVDVGSAEGSFSLDYVASASKIYLFETDEGWIEALTATFSPWKNKVSIINKFVSDKNNEDNISLDQYFNGGEKIDFIKIDVDGAELSLLKGGSKTFQNHIGIKISICTYHNQDDEQIFSDFFTKYGYSIKSSKGYMIFLYHHNIQPPYLRRGVIRARK